MLRKMGVGPWGYRNYVDTRDELPPECLLIVMSSRYLVVFHTLGMILGL